MDLQLATKTSVTRLRKTLREVRERTQVQLADLPDTDSGRYRWLKGYDTELGRLLEGPTKGGRLTVKPLAERLAEAARTGKVYGEATKETAKDLSTAIGPTGPIGPIRLAMPMIDKRALEFLEDYKLDLIKKVSTGLRGDIKSALRLGIIQGDGGSAITRGLAAKWPTAADRFERIVRTELARAQSEGHLEGYRQLGVTRVEIIGRGTDCPICGLHIGKIYLIQYAPHVPLHPNCRCDVVAVERGDGNWLVTERQIQDAVTKDLGDYSVTKDALREIARTNPESVYAWHGVPEVLKRGATQETEGTQETYSLKREKPFLAGFHRFAVTARGKSITGAKLSR